MSNDSPSMASRQMLVALNLQAAQGKVRLFEGVPHGPVAKRRAKNKVARRSRRANRVR